MKAGPERVDGFIGQRNRLTPRSPHHGKGARNFQYAYALAPPDVNKEVTRKQRKIEGNL
jgi:hypothetical protein